MGRKPAAVRLVKRVIKVTLHPERQRHLIDMIDNAPNKGRLVINALEGKQQMQAPAAANEDESLREELEGFLM